MEDIESYRSLDNDQIPPPLECFQRYVAGLDLDSDLRDRTSSLNTATSSCTRDMYHYARVYGKHVLECVVDTALSSVRREQLQEASNVCVKFYV